MTKYLDWSKHEVIIEDHGKLKIWRIKIPGTIMHQVNFINTEDRLIVTGDYGDWMFSREFWPSAENGVSQEYWLEKLRASMGRREDWELDKEYIRDRIKEFPDVVYRNEEVPEEVFQATKKEYLSGKKQTAVCRIIAAKYGVCIETVRKAIVKIKKEGGKH